MAASDGPLEPLAQTVWGLLFVVPECAGIGLMLFAAWFAPHWSRYRQAFVLGWAGVGLTIHASLMMYVVLGDRDVLKLAMIGVLMGALMLALGFGRWE